MIKLSFNRTIVGLKCEDLISGEICLICFNRTIVGLKSAIRSLNADEKAKF